MIATIVEDAPQLRLFDSTMMWCGCWVLQFIVLAHLACPPMRCCFPMTKSSEAALIVTKYANEAYSQWRWVHRDRRCPTFAGLNGYVGNKRAVDPWDEPYRMICTDRGIVVYSAGPDRYVGTHDDIWSTR